MHVSPHLLILGANVPDGKGKQGGGVVVLMVNGVMVLTTLSNIAAAERERSMLQHSHGSLTAFIHLTYFLSTSLPCAQFGERKERM